MAQISGDARVDQYTASAGQTTFTYTFKIYDDDEVTVQQNGVELTLTTDYTVTDAGEEAGGTIVLNSGATLDDVITITGNTIIARDTTFTDGGAFEADAINGEYNKLDDMVSELVTTFGKTVKLATYDASFDPTFTPNASRALKINAAGTGLEMSTYDPDSQAGDAEAFAEAAEASANEAADSATEASDSATEASGYADDASGYADDASGSADDAEAYAESINNDALASDIIPDADGTRDLGSATYTWAEIHCQDAYVGDDLTVTGTSNLDGGIAVDTDKFTVAAATGNTVIDGTLTVDGVSVTGYPKYALYTYVVSAGTQGGSVTQNTWTTRPINTEDYDNIGCTLDSNEITVPAGTYIITVTLNGYNVQNTKFVLYDSTNTTDLAVLGQCYFGVINIPFSTSTTVVIPEGGLDISFRQYSAVSRVNSGMGVATNQDGKDEVYLSCLMTQVA